MDKELMQILGEIKYYVIDRDDDIDRDHLKDACKNMTELFKDKPAYRRDILRMMKLTLRSIGDPCIGNLSECGNICTAMENMFEAAPECREDIFNMANRALQSSKSCFSHDSFLKTMDKMFKIAPECREDVLKAIKNESESRYGCNFHANLFEEMSEMFKTVPEYRKEILNTMKTELPEALQRIEELSMGGLSASGYFLEASYNYLDSMFKVAPEYGKDIYEIMKIGVCSGKNEKWNEEYNDYEDAYEYIDVSNSTALDTAYPILCKIVEKYPGLKEDFQRMSDDVGFSQTASNTDLKVPEDAFSRFSFSIEESVDDLVKQIKEKDGNMNTWQIHPGEPNKNEIRLYNYNSEENSDREDYSIVETDHDKMVITTVINDVITPVYTITNNAKGGADVICDAPASYLLQADLLPEMTYVKHTLKGQFYNQDTGENYTDFVYMNTYSKLRKIKNKDKKSLSEALNEWHKSPASKEPDKEKRRQMYNEFMDDALPQGYNKDDLNKALVCKKINGKFNNEISFFTPDIPQHEQEKKIRVAELEMSDLKDYRKWKQMKEKGKEPLSDFNYRGAEYSEKYKKKVASNKEKIEQRIKAVKTRREEAVSGAVVADEIAGKRRSGEVKEPVTPAKGNKLSAEIQAKIKEMKGNTKD